MSREIKFRSFHEYDPDDERVMEYSRDHDSLRVFFSMCSEEILMQYVGIKDQNGVEIYEGDIYKTNKLVGVVEGRVFRNLNYGHGECGFSVGISFFGNYGNGDDIEVIGNIYEHKHLLESKPS